MGEANKAACFGSSVFNDAVMSERLPKGVYKSLKKTIQNGDVLDESIADVVANAMKDWAVEKGATHYSHWFQPMTGLTAEKHDSFIVVTSSGESIMEFSGKKLIQGEPDASSFPSGGLRATFEARGYTAWDCTSPVFVKEDGENKTLYIPCAFCSYKGHALDKKTPLLRSMDALNTQMLRVLKALGHTVTTRVVSTLGPEQEYFLIDRSFVEKRLDLLLTGRTLFGAPSPRGQEMEDHYFGSLHERIGSFMAELNEELWKLGVTATTQHNEVAPGQYEVAPVFGTVNVATDHNQLCMDTLQKVALRHDFVCLLHEKPFAGVNGSGKHNNWSMGTDDGLNLLDPGSTPESNMIFMVVLSAIIKAVDTNAKLLRAAVATTGNEHRLGANEAPPAIVSIFLGDQLDEIFQTMAKGSLAGCSSGGGNLKLGVTTLPVLPKDCTDRNRTSPFAFSGNRFEFRMVGSSQSCAGPVFVINTIVADALREIADALEAATDVKAAAEKILLDVAKNHHKVVFNGDNYSEAWVAEAAKRGLPNIPSSVDALMCMKDKAVIDLFSRNNVLAADELHARMEILLEGYLKGIVIEGKTAISIAKRQILPAAIKFSGDLASTISCVKDAGGSCKAQATKLAETCKLIDELQAGIEAMEAAVEKATSAGDVEEAAQIASREIRSAMAQARVAADALETIVDAELWPLPTYAEMLFMR